MPYVRYKGGLGISPCGRTECGNAQSVIEPRFLSSIPVDQQRNVPVTATLKFITYGFSSWVDIPDVTVEISEDTGNSWSIAFDGADFLSPYDGVLSKIRRQGHSLIFYIQKTSSWPEGQKILIRFTGVDEFGQYASKVAPVVW